MSNRPPKLFVPAKEDPWLNSSVFDDTASIISKVWGFCTTLRDDGVGYGDYLEQLAEDIQPSVVQ